MSADKLKVEEFVKRGIVALRKDGDKGIHSKNSGFNTGFGRVFADENPEEVLRALAAEGKIAIREDDEGITAYLSEDDIDEPEAETVPEPVAEPVAESVDDPTIEPEPVVVEETPAIDLPDIAVTVHEPVDESDDAPVASDLSAEDTEAPELDDVDDSDMYEILQDIDNRANTETEFSMQSNVGDNQTAPEKTRFIREFQSVYAPISREKFLSYLNEIARILEEDKELLDSWMHLPDGAKYLIHISPESLRDQVVYISQKVHPDTGHNFIQIHSFVAPAKDTLLRRFLKFNAVSDFEWACVMEYFGEDHLAIKYIYEYENFFPNVVTEAICQVAAQANGLMLELKGEEFLEDHQN